VDSKEFIRLEEEYGAHNYHPLDVVIDRGEGVWVYDVDGNKYLDCLSAYSAVSHGHVHPEILEALKTQAERLTLVSRAFRNDQLPLWYKEISDLTGYEMSLPMNSGAEAVETAMKLARKWGYVSKKIPRHQAEIILATGNFHGRTISLISGSSEPLYRDDFGPFTPGFIVVPFGDLKELEKSITPNTAAILIEPIQGEAGVIVPPNGYLKQVSELCKKNNILLIIDEIQTGLGRTGKLFGYMHEDIRPDVVILGKALSGGFYPVSAVIADRSIMGLLQPGEHGSTFGGNPLAAAVSRAAMKVLIKDKMVENSAAMGEYFMEQLAEIPSKHIKEVRGKGLLIGVELKKEAGGARRFCEALLDKGILAKETHHSVIRFAPPLIITQEIIDWALPKIREVLLMA
jgi:ornithine--oxo-acid transaminase